MFGYVRDDPMMKYLGMFQSANPHNSTATQNRRRAEQQRPTAGMLIPILLLCT